ncbi:MAG TPA: ABC transporter ATP-binding protein [Usitatibacter sp.]|nr:ABC transporter ATP-binding protein [Usitatibacter sp.]HYC55800.1 ABC transporter ATP-binding protein [Candidatus Binatia bacterium]
MARSKVAVRGLTKVFAEPGSGKQTEALRDVSITIEAHEIVCLLGPSGCGKSTVLRVVAGFEQASGGEVLLDGRPIVGPGPDRGVVFQEQALFPWRSIYENIVYGPKIRGRPRAEYEELAERYIGIVGLRGFENHYPHELSGGMKQRVAIARVLMNAPEVLLMDEPFGALDAQTRATMHEWLLDLWQTSPRAALFITHDVDEAILLADRVYVMTARPGRIKLELAVDIPRPRALDVLTSDRFMALKREVLECIRTEARAALELPRA